MDTVRLEALGIDVRLPNHIRYHDEGSVGDIKEHTLSLLSRYGASESDESLSGYDWNGLIGQCFTYTHPPKPLVEKDIHIYWKCGLLGENEIFIRAHEETHALEKMGELGLLERAMRVGGIVNSMVVLRSFDEEQIASYGGLFAVRHVFHQEPTSISVDTEDSKFVLSKLGVFSRM